MKTFLVVLFMFVLAAVPAFSQGGDQSGACYENGQLGQWEYVYVCPPGHGMIGFWVCAFPGSCPGSAWCPGNNGCGFSESGTVSQVQKQGLEILVAKTYIKKPVTLNLDEVRTPLPKTLLAHGATFPPADCDPCAPKPSCSSCGWDFWCLWICIP